MGGVTRTKAKKSDKYEKKLAEMRSLVDGMSGVCKPMAEDLLETYVNIYQDYAYFTDLMGREGLLIEVEKGAANNRRVVREKHPAFDMRRNTINQMADLANKIKRFVKDDEGVVEDEFDSF